MDSRSSPSLRTVYPGPAGLRALAILLAALSLTPVAAHPRTPPATRAVREFTVVAERFMFTPDRIEVNQGDTVRVTVRSADGNHGWEVKAFDVDIFARKGGQPETREFVADKAGTFPINCSEYCGRGHKQMKGVLVVNPGGRS
ncbi:MAG: cytochrome c oxidase subunit [Acidobacteria bacterium]|nr:cytochrome c oxidase subunit [Acidobacteriota bacterium]